MKTNSKAVKEAVQAYLIDSLNTSEFPEHDGTTAKSIEIILNEFKRCAIYPNNLHRFKTYQACFADWLTGLPSCLAVHFSDFDILNFMESIGLPLPEDKDTQEGIKLYYHLLYRELLTLAKREKVTLPF